MLDIVLWWLERTNPEIKLARVHCLFDRFRFGEFLPDGNNHNVEKTAVITIQFFGDTGGHDPSCTASFFMTLAGPHYWKRESYYLVKKDWSRITIEGDRGRGQRTPPTIKTRDYDGSFERVLDADPEAGNDRPTRDFLDGLLGRGPAEETSAAASHVRAAKVVQAAYLSAISGTVQEVCLLHG